MTDSDLAIALSFAKLEILELQAGRRGLTECPGLKNVAKAIAAAERMRPVQKAVERRARRPRDFVPYMPS